MDNQELHEDSPWLQRRQHALFRTIRRAGGARMNPDSAEASTGGVEAHSSSKHAGHVTALRHDSWQNAFAKHAVRYCLVGGRPRGRLRSEIALHRD
jgi:hypothetical protein